MIGEVGRGTRPEQVRQVVASESLAGLEREADEKGEVLARAEPHLLARC
jgi:hypothetical protein